MSLPYRLGSGSLFNRPNENSLEPKRVVFLSTEGTITEVNYLKYIEQFREQLGINTIVHVEVLRKYDTQSDPDHVLSLLEEYIQFRNDNMFQDEISSLEIGQYPTETIRAYLDDPSDLSPRVRNRLTATLKDEHIDLLYLSFLNKYRGEDDAFGIVIDRDWRSHSVEQMKRVIDKCKQKGYLCYITNPCLEFWLLLHVADVSTKYSGQLDEILNNKVDEHGNTYVSNLLHELTGQRKAIQVKTFEKYYLPNVDLAIARAKGFASGDELLDKIGSNLGELIELLRMD